MASMVLFEKIKALRKDKGLKQAQLAEICGVSDDAVGLWERGKRIPDLDNLIKLADAFDISMDVFRPDAARLDLPHPHFNHDDFVSQNIPFRFGSVNPTAEQQKILDFCGLFLDSLDSRYFVKGVGQNSEFGTGRYFWESRIDYLMWIGFTPTLDGADCRYAYSVAINTETPLPSNLLATFDCLQVTDSDEENWIYVPIDLDETDSDRMLHNAKRSLKTAIEISRLALNVMTMKEIDAIRN